jgi:hypothetical protein
MTVEIHLSEQEYQDLLDCAEERGVDPRTLIWKATMDDLAR